MAFQEIRPADIVRNPFSLIGDDWLLVTCEADGRANTMTASWGALGVLWGVPAATIYIRPQRFTKTLLDRAASFTLSVLPETFRQTLGYLGRVSGRDEDKIGASGLTLLHTHGAPVFAEARLALVCKKLYAQEMRPDGFADPAPRAKWYPDEDYHTMYIGAIEAVLARSENQ